MERKGEQIKGKRKTVKMKGREKGNIQRRMGKEKSVGEKEM